MRRLSMDVLVLFGSVVLALSARVAPATAVHDLVRIKGHERNVLTGMGIVVGLNGTGDKSKDSYIAARPYSRLLTNLSNPDSDLEELAKEAMATNRTIKDIVVEKGYLTAEETGRILDARRMTEGGI